MNWCVLVRQGEKYAAIDENTIASIGKASWPTQFAQGSGQNNAQ
jgi:hypothetical protein